MKTLKRLVWPLFTTLALGFGLAFRETDPNSVIKATPLSSRELASDPISQSALEDPLQIERPPMTPNDANVGVSNKIKIYQKNKFLKEHAKSQTAK